MTKRRIISIGAVATAVLAVSNVAQAIMYTSVAAGGDFNTDATWGGSGHPGALDEARVNTTVSSGNLVTVSGSSAATAVSVGYGAAGKLAITSTGTLTLATQLFIGSVNSSGVGTVDTAGTLTINGLGRLWIGDGNSTFGTGTVNQTGGTVSATGILIARNGTGTYNLTNGVLKVLGAAGAITVGNGGTGTLNLGDAVTAGAIERVDANNNALTVGTATGTMQGHGTVGLTGVLTLNNGKIIADGWGGNADRTLDLSSLNAAIANTVENAADKGWYAARRGKLTLPGVAIANGNNTYNWGEAAADATIDLVNSARVAFTGLANTSSAKLTGSLLANDVSTLALPAETAWKSIGNWDFSITNGNFTSANITFRYDDAALATLGKTSTDLRVYEKIGGIWTLVTSGNTSVDSGNKLITASGVTSLGQFSVGVVVPEPVATLPLVLWGLGALARRRR